MTSRPRDARERRRQRAEADERSVDRHEIDRLLEVRSFEPARVRLLHHDDARVGAELLRELRAAHVDGEHARGAALEEAVREAARRRPDVRADEARGIEPALGHRRESAVELVAAARDEPRALAHGDRRVRREERPRLVDAGARRVHLAGEDEGLRCRA